MARQEETEDPLQEGPLPVPVGAVVNDASQASPNDPLHMGSTLWAARATPGVK